MEQMHNLIKLSQNENPFGASPLALKAITENCQSVYRYPDVFHETLRVRLASKYKVIPDDVIISAGSVGAMDMIIRGLAGLDENIVVSDKTFVAYKMLAKINRRSFKLAQLIDNTISPDNLISLCDEKTRVLFIANPNNPTGTIISHDALANLLNILPHHVFVVIDEAYAEYVTDCSYPNSFELQKEFSNLIILRTFSKIYGLAGLRIGYAIARSDVIQSLAQHRVAFSINRLAYSAALAALDDKEFLEKCASINDQERALLSRELRSLGFNSTPSHGNFILVEFADSDGKERFFGQLKNSEILVRKMEPFGVELGLRITVGRPKENRELLNCLKQIPSEYIPTRISKGPIPNPSK